MFPRHTYSTVDTYCNVFTKGPVLTCLSAAFCVAVGSSSHHHKCSIIPALVHFNLTTLVITIEQIDLMKKSGKTSEVLQP